MTGLDEHRMAIAYIFGKRAIEIERMSESDALDFILARLEKVLGSGIRDRVATSSRTQWGCDPHAAQFDVLMGHGKSVSQ